MFNNDCKECGNEVHNMQNTIGKPMEYDICLFCWENITKKKREKYIEDGVVPVTRFCVDEPWKEFCAKYGMRP